MKQAAAAAAPSRRAIVVEPEDRKPCQWCREPIHRAAVRCPHCAQWQGRLAWLGFPPVVALMFTAAYVLMTGTMYWRFASTTGRALSWTGHTAAYRSELKVVGSEMVPGLQDGKPALAVVGALRNSGTRPLADVRLEVQFTGPDGQLVDVQRLYTWLQTIGPGEERSFRMLLAPELPMSRYAGHEVFVRSAGTPPWL